MKNLVKLLGVIALAAVIGFSFAACPEPEEEGGPTTYGDKLEFSDEQVYVVERSEDNYFTINYKSYTGDVTFDSVYGATPKIVGGKFSLSVGVPTSLESINGLFSSGYEDDSFTDLKISDTTAKYATFYYFEKGNIELRRENGAYSNIKTSGSEVTSASYTSESVWFVYVDKPVKITGKGTTETDIDEDGSKYTWKTNDLNLSLSKGWNVVCVKEEGSLSETSGSTTYSMSVSNPGSLQWVLEDYSYWDWDDDDDDYDDYDDD